MQGGLSLDSTTARMEIETGSPARSHSVQTRASAINRSGAGVLRDGRVGRGLAQQLRQLDEVLGPQIECGTFVFLNDAFDSRAPDAVPIVPEDGPIRNAPALLLDPLPAVPVPPTRTPCAGHPALIGHVGIPGKNRHLGRADFDLAHPHAGTGHALYGGEGLARVAASEQRVLLLNADEPDDANKRRQPQCDKNCGSSRSVAFCFCGQCRAPRA